VSAGTAADAELAAYLSRPRSPPDTALLEAIERSPADPDSILGLDELDRLLDPSPLPLETGWCTRPDDVGYVAVRNPMPEVTGEMVDWWFDWHPRESIRYRIWHPLAHHGNSLDPPRRPGAKSHWGATHHAVEDVGTGMVRARISFVRPTEIGFSTDALDDPRVATIVCGRIGDERLRLSHTVMVHVFLADGDGVVLRSHFWLGALIPLRLLRRLALPAGLPHRLARHCAEEYTNLAALLPDLHARYGPDGARRAP
jgi:hypothetical protein